MRPALILRATLTAGLLTTLLGMAPVLQADVAVTTASGVYTREQARAGKALYDQHCLVCHDRKYFRPVLKRMQGQSARIIFDVMVGSMPESNPGGLTDQEYLDILAYIFSLSRYPAGETPLTASELDALVIGGG